VAWREPSICTADLFEANLLSAVHNTPSGETAELVLPGIDRLPAEDRRRSPFTGWTRDHWITVADELLAGVYRFASSRNAMVVIPGKHPSINGAASDGLEGYARTFLLAAYRLAASGGTAPGNLVARYSEGLRAGTEPRGDEAWPSILDHGQPIVEAASIALALYETRSWIWETLDDATRQRVVEWLSGVRSKRLPLGNWALFPLIVESFLKSVGAPYRQSEIEGHLDRADSWYRGNGWYTDGPGRSFDYYTAWGFHFHSLMWCRVDGDRNDPARAAVYRERVVRFLEQYRFLFGGDGAPLYHGRSLTYRFAVAAPVWAGAMLDATPLLPGETRRIASGALRHFLERGAIHDGLLTLGWYDEFHAMTQPYSGHGSPYWASKAFCGLLLPPDHPAWTAEEEPTPVERSDFCVAMPEPGFLVRGTMADGIVRVASHRSDHFPLPGRHRPRNRLRRAAGRLARALDGPRARPPAGYDVHYAKLAYSTHAAPECSGPPLDIDSQVTLITPDGAHSQRLRFTCLGVADRYGASVFHPDVQAGARVETHTIARGRAELRVHHVSAPGGGVLRDGGFAIASSDPPETVIGDGWSMVRRADGLTSFVATIHGFDVAKVSRSAQTNPFGTSSATPYVTRLADLRPEAICVSLVVLSAEPFEPEEIRQTVSHAEVAGRKVTVCLDGEWWFVQTVAPEHVEFTLGDRPIEGPIRVARASPDGTCFTLLASGNP
jgi:hypothetical protein